MNTITIDEFSTGIQVDGTPADWFSRGFSGSYMNSTLPQIPTIVQNSISLREFAVAEGALSEKPAIIGREITGNNEAWSVIAVVTRGKDDRGRSVSLYRYFLTEGIGRLGQILAWFLQRGAVPIFNPFEVKNVGEGVVYNLAQSTTNLQILPALQAILNQNSPPIVVGFNQPCTPLILNLMANQIGSPTAWAYNVEAVVKPARFQLIYPASINAEQIIKNAILTTPKDTGGFGQEQPFKTAIKNLMRKENVNLDQLEVFGQVLANPEVTREQLITIFESQGSKDAIRHNNYNPANVRLLTLQAIAIPDTLPELLKWLEKREKPTDHLDLCLNFQREILQSLTIIENFDSAEAIRAKATQGVLLIIPLLLKEKNLLISTSWLLQNKGLWQDCYFQKVRIDLDQDLQEIGRATTHLRRTKNQPLVLRMAVNQDWSKILNNLKTYCQHIHHLGVPAYLILGQLFEEIANSPEERKIALIFYHLAYGFGKIPSEKFELIDQNNIQTQIYGIRIKRNTNPVEAFFQSFSELFEIIMPLPFAIFLIVFCSALSFLGGTWIGANSNENQDNNTIEFNNNNQGNNNPNNGQNPSPKPIFTNSPNFPSSPTPTPTPTNTPRSSNYKINNPQLTVSGKSIENLIKEIDQYTTFHDTKAMEKTIEGIFQEVSGNVNLTFEQLVTNTTEATRAIKMYQKKVMAAKDGAADGKIESGGNTYQVLKCHLADDLGINVNGSPQCEQGYKKWRDSRPKPPVG